MLWECLRHGEGLWASLTVLGSGIPGRPGCLLLSHAPAWLLGAGLEGPARYNLLVGLVLWADAMAARAWLRQVGAGGAGAWLGGLVFALNPWTLGEIASGRLLHAMTLSLPLALSWLGRPGSGPLRAWAGGALLGLCSLVSPWQGTGLLCVLALVRWRWGGGSGFGRSWPGVALPGLAGLAFPGLVDLARVAFGWPSSSGMAEEGALTAAQGGGLAPALLQPFLYLALAALSARILDRVALPAGALARPLLAFGVGGLLLCQWAWMDLLPLPATRLEVAPLYHFLVALGPGAVLEASGGELDSARELAQTVHQRRLVGGLAQRSLPEAFPAGGLKELAAGAGGRPGEVRLRACLDALEGRQAPPEPLEARALWQAPVGGCRWLVLRERACHLKDPEDGERRYFQALSRLRATFGEPRLYTEEPVARRASGRRPGDRRALAWYRVAVFDLAPAAAPTPLAPLRGLPDGDLRLPSPGGIEAGAGSP